MKERRILIKVNICNQKMASSIDFFFDLLIHVMVSSHMYFVLFNVKDCNFQMKSNFKKSK